MYYQNFQYTFHKSVSVYNVLSNTYGQGVPREISQDLGNPLDFTHYFKHREIGTSGFQNLS